MLKKFKSLAVIFGLLICMYYFCGCGRTENKDESSNLDKMKFETEKAQNELEESLTTFMENEEPLESEFSSLHVKEYLQQILYISKEWQPGRFVVVGIDQTGDKCCGILDEEGTFEIFEEYTGLYPLSEGRLLATQDVNAPLCLQTQDAYAGTALNQSTVMQGKIIEESGNVIYEPEDKYARMTIVNSKAVMVFSAKSGLEGKSMNICVVDNDGNLLKESLPSLENYLLDKMYFVDNGLEWGFKEFIVLMAEGHAVKCVPVIYRGSEKCHWENNIIQFSIKQNIVRNIGIGSYIYHTNLQDAIWMEIEKAIYEINDSELYQEGVVIPGSIFYAAAICDINTGERLRIMKEMQNYRYQGSFLEKDGFHYYFTDLSNGNLLRDENVVEFSNLDGRIKDYNGEFWSKKGEQFIYTLCGADREYYLTVLDSNGSMLFEPVRMKGFEQQFQENYILCLDKENNIYIIDLNNGIVELKYEMPQKIGMEVREVNILSDTVFSIGWSWKEDYGTSYYYNVYSYENEEIKSIF